MAQLSLFTSLMRTQCSRGRPANLGVTDGKLSPCPDSHNCVSSQSTDKKHYIEPLRYQGTLAEARDRLVSVVHSMGRSTVVTVQENNIHAEFASGLSRFIDDVELYFDDNHKIIHLRSASRIGYSDLGVNRKKISVFEIGLSLRKDSKTIDVEAKAASDYAKLRHTISDKKYSVFPLKIRD